MQMYGSHCFGSKMQKQMKNIPIGPRQGKGRESTSHGKEKTRATVTPLANMPNMVRDK